MTQQLRWALPLLLAACHQAVPQTPQPVQTTTPAPATATRTFRAIADSVINSALPETHWGIEVFDPAADRVLFAHNPQRHFIPASNTKLVVTTVALGTLGPEWRYQTPIYIGGTPGSAEPRGLLIVGQGDPTMSGRFHNEDDFAVVKLLADSLQAKGIRRINGDIVVDASLFTTDRVQSSWEIGDLPWYYAAPLSPFAIAEGALRMIVLGGAAAGAPATAAFVGADFPHPVVVRAVTDTVGARASIDVDFEAWPDTLIITGKVAPGKADSSWIAIPDQASFAAQALRDELRRRGIPTTGAVRVARDSMSAQQLRASFNTNTPLLTWTSAPLKEIAAAILKPSQNWIAEQLLRTLGARLGGEGSWRKGIEVERRYLIDVVRIDSLAFSLRDGSGLSAQNLLSPHATVQLLDHARRAPWGNDYRAALPAPGERKGTLSNRLSGLETQLVAKTGTIANVNSLSGYLRTADNRDLIFAIYTNASGRPSSQVRNAIDALINALVRERANQ
ncbi:MAG TPA: D-alanyl-D-alanine carboxypeptidase/D-alanyl-D-alanine-endopeptidase [Longimicrobiales bacterium]|nr:D-alanyl-D-alanine carboxypeptidase/D-alanyl-D-alanine-endopeptidase [Longimicrobiales bacterium]